MRTVSQKLTTTKFSELRRLFPSKTLLITMAAALALQVNKSMAGCYCMMESKAIAAAYNKSGFWEICHTSTNEIVQVFLHSESISKSNYNIDSHDNTTSYSWSFHWHDTSKMIGDVDIHHAPRSHAPAQTHTASGRIA